MRHLSTDLGIIYLDEEVRWPLVQDSFSTMWKKQGSGSVSQFNVLIALTVMAVSYVSFNSEHICNKLS